MALANRIKWTCGLALALVAVLPLASSQAAAPDDIAAPAAKAPGKTVVDLFDAMKRGDIDVKYIAKNSLEGQLLVKNNTDQPLTVKLPDAFAAVPVLGQQLGAGGAGAGTRGNRNTGGGGGGQNQGVGGGGQGQQGGGNRQGGGAFDVAPEKVAKIKVETVCLEHGKKEPTATVPYEIRPIESFTSDPSVQELCKLVGSGQASPRAAQAAAWHLANHMTWEQLTDKKVHHLLGGNEVYFSKEDIRVAMQLTDRAMKAADARPKDASTPSGTPSPTTSASAAQN